MKKKGFVLASVVAIMVFVIILSNAIFLTIYFSTNLSANKKNAFDKNIIYSKIFSEFCENSGAVSTDYDFDIITAQDENDINQKIVVVLQKGESDKSNILFYAIYDFNSSELIAKQSKNVALKLKLENGKYYYYLADIFSADITEYMEV